MNVHIIIRVHNTGNVHMNNISTYVGLHYTVVSTAVHDNTNTD